MLLNKRLSYPSPKPNSSIWKKNEKKYQVLTQSPRLRPSKSLSDLDVNGVTNNVFLGNTPVKHEKALQLSPYIQSVLSPRWGSHKHSSDPTGLFERFFSLNTVSDLRQLDITALQLSFDYYGIVGGTPILTITRALQHVPTPDPEADVEILYNGLFGIQETNPSPLIESYNPIIDQLFLMTLDTLATCPNNRYQQIKGLAMLDNCWKGFAKETNSQLYSDSLFKLLTYVQDHQGNKAIFSDFIVTLQHVLKRIPESKRDIMRNAFMSYIDTLSHPQQQTTLYKLRLES